VIEVLNRSNVPSISIISTLRPGDYMARNNVGLSLDEYDLMASALLILSVVSSRFEDAVRGRNLDTAL
jgi:hypothetical protein